MLHGHTQFYSIHKKRRHLLRHCKRFETRFDTSNDQLDNSLPTGKNKKVIGLMKDELGGKIMTAFAALRPKIIVLYLIAIKSQRHKKIVP